MLKKSSSPSASDSYVFVSYSHQDAKRVNREIRHLEQNGISVWYDYAIRPGHRWRLELAEAIEGCSAFILFTSSSAIQSANCLEELTFAAGQSRPLLQVQLEETELPTEFQFILAAHQAIHAWEMPTREYRTALVESLQHKLKGVLGPISKPHGHHRRPAGASRQWLIGGSVVSLVVLLAALVSTSNFWPPSRSGTPDHRTVSPYEASDRSVAILRFITLGEDSTIGDGLCEHLLHLLMEIEEISVPSRTSSWLASEEDREPREIAQRLGVRYVLEGSVQQVADRLRVTAQLIDGFTGLHVWSDSYDEYLTANSFFEIQDNIASELASHLQVTLSSASSARLAVRPTDNDEALDAYLRGRALRRGPTTTDNIDAAQRDFTAALDADPDFAEAHAALCESHLAAYSVVRDGERFNTAKQHCLEARRIDPDHTVVLTALGTLYRHEGRLQDAEVEINRALNMQPRNTAVMEEQGRLLRSMGRYEDARAVFEEAIRTEPGNWSVYKSMGNFLVRTGEYTEAIGLYRQSLRLDPGNEVSRNNLATTLHLAGEFSQASELWSQISEQTPSFLALLNGANARFYEGRYEDAIRWFGRAIEVSNVDFRAYGGRASSREYGSGLEAARDDYRKAAELALVVTERNRNDPQALSRLCFYQAKLGETALAQAGLARLNGLDAIDPDSRFMMALTFITLDEFDQAQIALDQAISAGFSIALVEADPLVARVRERIQLSQT